MFHCHYISVTWQTNGDHFTLVEFTITRHLPGEQYIFTFLILVDLNKKMTNFNFPTDLLLFAVFSEANQRGLCSLGKFQHHAIFSNSRLFKISKEIIKETEIETSWKRISKIVSSVLDSWFVKTPKQWDFSNKNSLDSYYIYSVCTFDFKPSLLKLWVPDTVTS